MADDVEPKTDNLKDVSPDEYLYLGIITNPFQFKLDPKLGKYRVTSVAFKGYPKYQLSVDIASKTSPQDCRKRLPKSSAIVRFPAKVPIQSGARVVEDPTPTNPAHALVLFSHVKGESGKRAIMRNMARSCVWAIPPKGGYDLVEPILDYDE